MSITSMRRIIISIIAAVGLAAAVPAAARAATSGDGCTTIHDTITKTDNGHGTPAAWADLVLHRSTKVCGGPKEGYTVTLADTGRLWTRAGAGTPNGTGGQITHRVPGKVTGTYALTVTGGHLAARHGDTSASSTAYVTSLFSEGATVKGGAYTWTYVTCAEKWVDSSANNDGQGAQAGNITGLRCKRTPSPTPTPTPTDTETASPSPSPTSSTPTGGGQAPPAQPIDGQPHFTG